MLQESASFDAVAFIAEYEGHSASHIDVFYSSENLLLALLTRSSLSQVQRWAPTADRRLNVQILIGFGSGNVDIQWNGPQAEAEAAVQASGLLNIPGLLVGFLAVTKSRIVEEAFKCMPWLPADRLEGMCKAVDQDS